MSKNRVVPPFNFDKALRINPLERMRLCVNRVRDRLRDNGDWDVFGVAPVPDSGATEEELRGLESELGVKLPDEYRVFLMNWRYLLMDDGLRIWGFRDGSAGIGSPWVSDQHRLGARYLVLGDYWAFADGDQLLFALGEPKQEVVAYLHEHGPLFESFAPSFSLALWRIVEEWMASE